MVSLKRLLPQDIYRVLSSSTNDKELPILFNVAIDMMGMIDKKTVLFDNSTPVPVPVMMFPEYHGPVTPREGDAPVSTTVQATTGEPGSVAPVSTTVQATTGEPGSVAPGQPQSRLQRENLDRSRPTTVQATTGEPGSVAPLSTTVQATTGESGSVAPEPTQDLRDSGSIWY